VTERLIIHSTDIGQGFTIDQIENERGELYYRVCKGTICRYCEDEYFTRMYAAEMGWNPLTD
jgi:hypothetical protein